MSEYMGSNEVVKLPDGRFLVKNNQEAVEKSYKRIFGLIEKLTKDTCILDILTAVALVGVHMGQHQKVSKANFLNIISQEWERVDAEK